MKKTAPMIFFFAFFLLCCSSVKAVILEQETTVNRIKIPPEFTTKVSARVGGCLFDIEGLTSAFARVEFSSSQGNVNLETIADDQGIFHFYNALMPLYSGDFCFTAIDTQNRSSAPVCFSPPAAETYTSISGIILPPTISIEKGVYWLGEENSAEGATVPSSEVRVFLFEDNKIYFWSILGRLFSRPILAREGPNLEIKSDSRGDFSFNLPTDKPSVWKLYVGATKTQLGENPSPKSNTIQFAALSFWQWWLINHPFFITILLLSAIALIIYLLIRRKYSSRRAKQTAKFE
ncbi:MAG: hypothetical protein ABIB61_00720 [Candidatus Shapirobacteria bacterium]